jgi:hypothetical protein
MTDEDNSHGAEPLSLRKDPAWVREGHKRVAALRAQGWHAEADAAELALADLVLEDCERLIVDLERMCRVH